MSTCLQEGNLFGFSSVNWRKPLRSLQLPSKHPLQPSSPYMQLRPRKAVPSLQPCYCSFETKSQVDVQGIGHLNIIRKRDETYAQEVSQIIGMIHQRLDIVWCYVQNIECELSCFRAFRIVAKHPALTIRIPLISAAQNFAWVTIAQFHQDYIEFLKTGNEKNEPFLHVEEYGPWDLTDKTDFKRFSHIVVALINFLQNAGRPE